MLGQARPKHVVIVKLINYDP